MEEKKKEYVNNPGYGSLLTNFKKENANQPDMTGSLKLERAYAAGEEVKISAWNKPNPKGLIISLKENNWKPDGTKTYPVETNAMSGDVPF